VQDARRCSSWMKKKILDSPFLMGRCFPVCDEKPDEGMDWDSLCRSSPLAIALGCTSEAHCQKAEAMLAPICLDMIEKQSDDDGVWSIIASNEPFARAGESNSRSCAVETTVSDADHRARRC
jgi:hypothetical protein